MATTTTLDGTGRIVIPSHLREALNLSPGDKLAVEAQGETISLIPLRHNSRLYKKKGIWVMRGSGKPFSPETANKIVRDLRERHAPHTR